MVYLRNFAVACLLASITQALPPKAKPATIASPSQVPIPPIQNYDGPPELNGPGYLNGGLFPGGEDLRGYDSEDETTPNDDPNERQSPPSYRIVEHDPLPDYETIAASATILGDKKTPATLLDDKEPSATTLGDKKIATPRPTSNNWEILISPVSATKGIVAQIAADLKNLQHSIKLESKLYITIPGKKMDVKSDVVKIRVSHLLNKDIDVLWNKWKAWKIITKKPERVPSPRGGSVWPNPPDTREIQMVGKAVDPERLPKLNDYGSAPTDVS